MTAKAIKNWLGMVADYGCVACRESQVQVHHVFGRTYKHTKVLIGPWYVLPLHPRYHDVGSDNPFNVTHYPKKFAIAFGCQRHLFMKMCEAMERKGIELPFDDEVWQAIMDSPLR